MKLITLFLLLGISICTATNSYSQSTLFTFKIENKAIADIISQIEENSEYVFFYHEDSFDTQRVTNIEIHNETIDHVLDKLLEGTPNTYLIDDRQVYIISSQNNTPMPTQESKSIMVYGTVKDEKGELLLGVTIQELGTNNITVTNGEGKYTLYNVTSEASVLKISYIGFASVEITVGTKKEINIILKEDTQGLEEVVVVGYGHQKKESVIGAITTVKPSVLQINQSRSISNALGGQIAGIISIQRSGEPGYDTSDFWIRGINTFGANSNPLVLVDGIERSLNNISPEEIESFSVLKDATATAVYGVRGANGVILIQTKKGQVGKPRITVKADYGFSSPTQLPDFVDGAKYKEIMNAAQILSGIKPVYSAEDIEKTRTGVDPDFFPSVNWIKAITHSHVPNGRATVDINGGSEIIQYSLVLSYFGEEGMLVTDPEVNYDAAIKLSRYNVRSNVDINLTSSTLINVGIGGYLMHRNAPGVGVDGILSSAFETPPIVHPIRYSNGQIPKNASRYNPWASATQTGYTKRNESNIQSMIGLTQDIGKLYKPLEGLTFKGIFSFDSWNWNNVDRTKQPTFYEAYGRDEEGNLLTTIISEGQEFLNYSKSAGGNRNMYMELRANYQRRFGEHLVDGLFLYNMRDYENADAESAIYALPYRNQGIAGRAAYSFRDTYFTEFNFGYNGSENFQKGYRFGFFPSVAIGWLISNEPFMKNTGKILSNLKLRASYGLVGNDQLSGRRFAYLSTVDGTTGYQWGYTGEYERNGWQEGDFGINNLKWETASKGNIGIELGLLSTINLQLDVFKEIRKDIFMQRKTIPEIAGYNKMPWANYGKVENKGIDMSLDVNHRLGQDLFISARGTFTYAKNKILEYDEPAGLKNTPQAHTGQPLNQYYGLIADGLLSSGDFSDPENGILNEEMPAYSFGPVKPGDIKYVDINDDGKIDSYDISPIGKPSIPQIIYGFGVNLKYKNVDFGAFFQGAGNFSNMVGGDNFIPGSGAGGLGNIYANVDDRWTPENPSSDVFWPRLYNTVSKNNQQPSTWWLKDASYLRLKNLEIGYTLPKQFQKAMQMRNARVFFRGTNLLTWAAFDMWDPELGSNNGLRYPAQKVCSFGFEVTF